MIFGYYVVLLVQFYVLEKQVGRFYFYPFLPKEKLVYRKPLGNHFWSYDQIDNSDIDILSMTIRMMNKINLLFFQCVTFKISIKKCKMIVLHRKFYNGRIEKKPLRYQLWLGKTSQVEKAQRKFFFIEGTVKTFIRQISKRNLWQICALLLRKRQILVNILLSLGNNNFHSKTFEYYLMF